MISNWDFVDANTKETTHIFHSYPAMLVPQIATKLIHEYKKNNTVLFDPFCGTGTTLVEANLNGINAIGTDLNPLARLISKVKTTNIEIQSLDLYIKDFYDYLFHYRFGFEKKDSVVVPKFQNINFWFSKQVISDLSIIKKYLDEIKDESIQDFFRVAFSQTIRDCSWTRKNEFKLYRMDNSRRKNFKPDVFSAFESILARNRNGLQKFITQKTNPSTSHIYNFNTVNCIPNEILSPNSVGLVITSPPYGDSQTTVAYGQYSRLAIQWLWDEERNQLDSILMGGKKSPEIEKFQSRSLDLSLKKIEEIDEKRCKEVVSFYKDYRESVRNVAKVIKRKGYACYIVSNRCVKGITLKTDQITKDFFEKNGFNHVKTIERKISNKRMPRKNSPIGIAGETSTLMNKEYIVIMQKR